ncbi:MAG TPA: ABC transporter ATP-binding protein [Nitrososphaerales archaeon]|nr:ABC transporter ATP-binding protein [Nitrososphaerales archaeon]
MPRILSIQNFSFRYPGAQRLAVDSFDLEVDRSEIIILAGPSGCGKSTLLRSINGLIPHMYSGDYSGAVLMDGANVREESMRALAQKVGFLFQNPENQIFMFSVERDVAFGLENLGVPREEMRRRVDEAMAQLGITHLARRAPHELSDGQKQRVALAGVLAMQPGLVILDEPTSLLDPMTASELVELVDKIRRENGTTFIVVEHRLDLLVRIADRLVVMNSGKKVLDGSCWDVLTDERAEGYGLSVPAIVKLEKGLNYHDVGTSARIPTAAQLAEEVNSRTA